jgi:hypothetical protein
VAKAPPAIVGDIVGGLMPLAVELDSLELLDGNPRRGDVDAVAASLRRFGQRKPIVVRASDRQIIAGNHTWQAAKQLGWSHIAAVLVDDDLTTSQAFALADNRTSELGSYDELSLLELIREVGGVDPAMLLDAGWSEDAVRDLVDRIDPDPLPPAPDDAPPVPVTPYACLGDVWLLGEHRVLCGDATSLDDLERLMDGQLADVVWTDPPYNVAVDGIAGKIANDDMSSAAFAQFMRDVMSSAIAVMAPGAGIYVAHSETERLAFTAAFLEAGLKLSSVVVWVKSSFTLSRSDYQWQHEPVLYGWKPGARHRWYGDRRQASILDLGGGHLRAGGRAHVARVPAVDDPADLGGRPGRDRGGDHCDARRQAFPQRGPSDDEADRPGATHAAQQREARPACPRPVRRVGLDAHGSGRARHEGSPARAGSAVRGRHLPSLAGAHQEPAGPRVDGRGA